MADQYAPRLFARAEDIRATGVAMLACTLPKADWTHEAHLATCLWLITQRPDIDVDSAIGALIRRYNEAVGGVNDDHSGIMRRSRGRSWQLCGSIWHAPVGLIC